MKTITICLIAFVMMWSATPSWGFTGPREDATAFVKGFFADALHDESADIN